jgi:hypothetical protein
MAKTGGLIGAGLAGLLALAGPASAADAARPLVSMPELVVARQGGSMTLALPGTSYDELSIAGLTAEFNLEGTLPAGEKLLRGQPISRIAWTPLASDVGEWTHVQVEFTTAPASSLLNAVPGTPGRPRTPQVLAGFIFPASSRAASPSVMGARPEQAGAAAPALTAGSSASEPGSYRLPPMRDAHYSDALVTLKVVNADFRDVLFLMSRIGGVSIVLDPYYEDEPTGNIRQGKGGGTGGDAGGGAAGGPPGIPQDGTGSVTLNFNEVPFDQALSLLLETVGLVKADIYPNS